MRKPNIEIITIINFVFGILNGTDQQEAYLLNVSTLEKFNHSTIAVFCMLMVNSIFFSSRNLYLCSVFSLGIEYNRIYFGSNRRNAIHH